jgi:hypothetical protein
VQGPHRAPGRVPGSRGRLRCRRGRAPGSPGLRRRRQRERGILDRVPAVLEGLQAAPQGGTTWCSESGLDEGKDGVRRPARKGWGRHSGTANFIRSSSGQASPLLPRRRHGRCRESGRCSLSVSWPLPATGPSPGHPRLSGFGCHAPTVGELRRDFGRRGHRLGPMVQGKSKCPPGAAKPNGTGSEAAGQVEGALIRAPDRGSADEARPGTA